MAENNSKAAPLNFKAQSLDGDNHSFFAPVSVFVLVFICYVFNTNYAVHFTLSKS